LKNDKEPQKMTQENQYRATEYPIDKLFTERWSPRAFTGEAIDESTLFSFFEAARWAPSANNAQPWRFIYILKGSSNWGAVISLLNENNQRWAVNASAIVVLVSKTVNIRPGESEPTPLRSHSHDAGAAWASLAFQAQISGWRTHAIGGFDREKARGLLDIPALYHVETAIAIGRQGERESLPPEIQAREQPTPRKPLKAFIAEGRFDFAE
jgi:nitroreductase